MNTFEQSLLTELREHVAQRTPARSRRWRWAGVPIAAVAAGAAVFALQPNPAYAVSESGDQIVITIKRLDDADGLEHALAEHGIEADVSYDTDASGPPPGTGEVTEHAGPQESGGVGAVAGPAGPDAAGPDSGDQPVPPPGASLAFSMTPEGLQLTLDRDDIPAGQTLSIVTTGSLDSAGLSVGWLAD